MKAAIKIKLTCVPGINVLVFDQLLSAKCTQVCAAICGRVREHVVRERVCVRSRRCSRKHSHPHISAALPVHRIISYYSPRRMAAGKGRVHWCLERQVGQVET